MLLGRAGRRRFDADEISARSATTWRRWSPALRAHGRHSRRTGAPTRKSARTQAENLRKMLLAMVEDIRVVSSSSPSARRRCARS
jgi:hypothetical protein